MEDMASRALEGVRVVDMTHVQAGPSCTQLMAWLGAARDAGAQVLIGDPGRSYFPRQGLSKLAEYRVATSRELEDAEVKKTGVWTLAA